MLVRLCDAGHVLTDVGGVPAASFCALVLRAAGEFLAAGGVDRAAVALPLRALEAVAAVGVLHALLLVASAAAGREIG